MSISYDDSNLKIWNFLNQTCLINIFSIFLNKQNIYYFVINHFEDSKFADSIKVYDYDKKIYKIVWGSEFNISLIEVFYTNEETYIITCNEDNIKSFNHKQNNYSSNIKTFFSYLKIISFSIYKGNTSKLFCSSYDNTIGIWDYRKYYW